MLTSLILAPAPSGHIRSEIGWQHPKRLAVRLAVLGAPTTGLHGTAPDQHRLHECQQSSHFNLLHILDRDVVRRPATEPPGARSLVPCNRLPAFEAGSIFRVVDEPGSSSGFAVSST